MPKYLIRFYTDSEYSGYEPSGLLNLTPELAQQILTRMNTCKRLLEQDSSLHKMVYWSLDIFYLDYSKLAEELQEKYLEYRDNEILLLTEENFAELMAIHNDASSDTSIRTECDMMRVGDSEVSWSCSPRYPHGVSEDFSSTLFSRKEIEKAAALSVE